MKISAIEPCWQSEIGGLIAAMYLLMIGDTRQFPETGNQWDLVDYFEGPIDIFSSMLHGCPAGV